MLISTLASPRRRGERTKTSHWAGLTGSHAFITLTRLPPAGHAHIGARSGIGHRTLLRYVSRSIARSPSCCSAAVDRGGARVVTRANPAHHVLGRLRRSGAPRLPTPAAATISSVPSAPRVSPPSLPPRVPADHQLARAAGRASCVAVSVLRTVRRSRLPKPEARAARPQRQPPGYWNAALRSHQSGSGSSLRGVRSGAFVGRMGSGFGLVLLTVWRAGAARVCCQSDKSAMTAKWSDGHMPFIGALPPSRAVSIRPRSCCGNPTST